MNSLTLRSPAKVNLFLKVTRRRPDGYHELVTLFHRISLCDELSLKKSKTFSLRTNIKNLSPGENNLITKAYRLLQRKFPSLGGASVTLKKNIPIGAGLGGGSGNAATFLRGMKKLYGLNISESELMNLGASLGADIPFFISNTTQAIGLQRGDKIQKLRSRQKYWFLLVLDRKPLITREVYRELARHFRPASLTKAKSTAKLLCNYLHRKEFKRLPALLQNDLEVPAFRLRPELKKKLAFISQSGAPAVRMSGSGPTFFVLVASKKQAHDAARKLKGSIDSKHLLVCHSY